MLGLLVPRDGADQVATQRARRHGETGQSDIRESSRDAPQRGAARADHEHPLVLPDQRPDGVHDGLGSAGPGQRLDDHGVAGRDLCDHVFLLGVGVEEQRVEFGRALVRIPRRDRLVALLDPPFRGRVPGQGVQHRMGQLGGIRAHISANVGERGDHEPRLHVEPLQMRRQPAEPIDDRVGLERAVLLGQGDERVDVQADLELLLEGAGQCRVQEGGAA